MELYEEWHKWWGMYLTGGEREREGKKKRKQREETLSNPMVIWHVSFVWRRECGFSLFIAHWYDKDPLWHGPMLCITSYVVHLPCSHFFFFLKEENWFATKKNKNWIEIYRKISTSTFFWLDMIGRNKIVNHNFIKK